MMSNNIKDLNRNGVPKPCTILGLHFDSHTQRNKHFGLEDRSLDIIEKRLARGWTEEQAVGVAAPPLRARDKSGNPKLSTYKMFKEIDGTIYPDASPGEFKIYKILCVKNGKEYIGLTIQSLKGRLRGQFNEALKTKSSSKFHRAIRKYGKQSFTISLIRNDAQNYKELGDQEIEEIKKRDSIKVGYNTSFGGDIGTAKEITIHSKKFSSWTIAANYYEVPPYNFSQRITKLGWTPEEAAGLVKRTRYQCHVVELAGKTFLSLKVAAEAYDKDYKKVFARKIRGWTLRQMFDLDSPPNEKQMTNPIKVKSLNFASQAELARYLSISPALITKLKPTLTFEEIYEKYSK
tara:strand:+ start:19 stop:1062 length:1044 start_codon:yes stop_codon:yes gene_type:complete